MFPWNFFPFNKQIKDQLPHLKPEELEQFIRSMMGKSMPGGFAGIGDNPEEMKGSQHSPHGNIIQAVTFETHDSIFVRFPIANDQWLKQLRVYHTANQLIVEHIPNFEDKHTITLPAIVRKKGASSKYKDGILELKLLKSVDMQFSEIEVSDI